MTREAACHASAEDGIQKSLETKFDRLEESDRQSLPLFLINVALLFILWFGVLLLWLFITVPNQIGMITNVTDSSLVLHYNDQQEK